MSYFERPELSQSQLKDFMVSPAYYQLRLKKARQETYEMMIGTATHSALLEPESFAENYVCIPKIDRRTKAGKEQFDLYTKESFGKIAIQEDDYLSILAMRDSVLEHGDAGAILRQKMEAEKEIYFELEGVACKSKLDAISIGAEAVIDLKTTQSARTESFIREIFRYGYDVQAYFYCEAYRALMGDYPRFYTFIIVSKEEPYPVNFIQADDKLLDSGRMKTLEALKKFKECVQTNIWQKNESEKVIKMTTPDWAIRDLIERGESYFATTRMEF